MKYYPSLTTAEEPSSASDSDVRYKLLDIYGSEGLWTRRSLSELFASDGTFRGDTSGGCGYVAGQCGTNSANAPWGWDDGNDGAVARGRSPRIRRSSRRSTSAPPRASPPRTRSTPSRAWGTRTRPERSRPAQFVTGCSAPSSSASSSNSDSRGASTSAPSG
ncbi:hypothetical protein ACN28S_05860 [Cystobacter fuscus]